MRPDRVELAGMVVGIARRQQPAVAGVDGHARVSTSVSGQGDKKNLPWQPGQLSHRVEPEPAFTEVRIGLPPRAVLELWRLVAEAFRSGMRALTTGLMIQCR
jgi:hypothetical protein